MHTFNIFCNLISTLLIAMISHSEIADCHLFNKSYVYFFMLLQMKKICNNRNLEKSLKSETVKPALLKRRYLYAEVLGSKALVFFSIGTGNEYLVES